MSAEDEGGMDGGAPQQVNLGVYKNPELIESVVVFDPIGGAQQKFLDVINITMGGMFTYQNDRFAISQAGGITDGEFKLAGQTVENLGSYNKYPVCREVSTSGGEVRMDVRTATNPIQFRFDGIPLVLPRESYIEVTLNLVYYGADITITFDQMKDQLDGLFSRGWARTASGLIQLVQAVDVSATSFQSTDMTTQNFLEAVQTKDAEIELRPDYYFNSYVTGANGLSNALRQRETLVYSPAEHLDFPGVFDGIQQRLGPAVYTTPAFAGGLIRFGDQFPVTFRIPLAAISPVFKTDCLPLFMTNSTNINIQFQVQNPNVPFPLHNPMNGNFDQTSYIDKTDAIWGQIPAISQSGFLQSQDEAVLTAVSPMWFDGLTPAERTAKLVANKKGTDIASFQVLYPVNGAIDGVPLADMYAGTGIYHNIDAGGAAPTWGIAGNKAVQGVQPGGGIGVVSFGNAGIGHYDSKTVKPIGQLNYLYWAPEFTVKAYIKTYAAAYGNPLVSRYLRPYLVGPEGQPSFFRSAFLSYNFSSMTYTVPANSTIPFNFNISQTLLNVPAAFLLFSEISYSMSYDTNRTMLVRSGMDADGDVYPTVYYTQGAEFPGLDETGGMTVANGTAIAGVPWNSVAPSVTSRPPEDGFSPIKQNTYSYGLMDVLHRSQYFISHSLEIRAVQVSIGPSGWNLYQRPLDMKALNEVTLNTLTRYDSEMVWKERVANPQRFHLGDAWACFDLSHDEFRGLFIDADNMLNITGELRNTSGEAKTVYVQLILPYVDHFVINLADSTVTKSQV